MNAEELCKILMENGVPESEAGNIKGIVILLY